MLKRFYASLLVISQIVVLVAAPVAHAATAATNSGQGIELSPPVIEIKADPGQIVTGEIKLRNITKSDLIAKSKVNDFSAKGEDGQPQISLDDSVTSRFSLKSWIQPIANLRLAPQKIETIKFSINVPRNAEPGGHYGVIRFTAQAPELEGTGVALSASIGSLILLSVSGDAKEGASIASFKVAGITTGWEKAIKGNGGPDVGLQDGNFYEYGPVRFTTRVKNEGNVQVKPVGTIDIFNIFGMKVASLKVNDPARNVLPESIRRFDVDWKQRWLIGYFKARANLTYGASNKTLLSSSVGFWVVPYKLLALLLLGLILFVMIFRSILRRYNRHIIAQARKRR